MMESVDIYPSFEIQPSLFNFSSLLIAFWCDTVRDFGHDAKEGNDGNDERGDDDFHF